ncbi:MAG: signal transduction histidine kinase [Psychromonas sp.]|jgi:signal transduction histidine kinase|uniref:sensor histidine kinase n=1 Tax=Psychromonas sp. TaxID=1884585 RepID=UPI0039E36B93
MKIKPSLKIYFTVAMLLLGFVMTVSFSALTLNYFTQGLDRGIKQSLMEAAEIQGSQKGKPVLLLGFHIASSWEDVPNRVKEIFDNTPPVESYTLEKRAVSSGLFRPPEEIYFVLKAVNKAGQLRYISKIINKADVRPGKHHGIPHIAWIGVFAIAAIGLFLLVVLFIIRKVAKPVESLKDWAKSLDEDKLTQPIPDFQYSELNTLAEIINSSLDSVQETLSRELQFLSYASHELRTPISVVRANTELLIKLHEKEGGTKKQFAVLERIDRAGKTMTNLTETLLWLSRDDANLPANEKVDIAQLIEQLVGEIGYLLENKQIQLEVDIAPYTINVAAIPCRIILANLIRNAFQHTIEGKVSISQVKGSVSIVNASEDKVIDSSDLGFGLGLRLTKKLAANYNWSYWDKIEGSSYQVKINF